MTPCFGEELFIRYLCVSIVKVFFFISVCSSSSFGFDDGMWDLNIFVSDHCLSLYFASSKMHSMEFKLSNVSSYNAVLLLILFKTPLASSHPYYS